MHQYSDDDDRRVEAAAISMSQDDLEYNRYKEQGRESEMRRKRKEDAEAKQREVRYQTYDGIVYLSVYVCA